VNVVDAYHKRVISLMQTAGTKGKVTLRVRRQDDVTATRKSFFICLFLVLLLITTGTGR